MAELDNSEDTLLTLTADIVAAHVSNNSVAVNDLPNLIQNVHGALSGIAGSSTPSLVRLLPVGLLWQRELRSRSLHLCGTAHRNSQVRQSRRRRLAPAPGGPAHFGAVLERFEGFLCIHFIPRSGDRARLFLRSPFRV